MGGGGWIIHTVIYHSAGQPVSCGIRTTLPVCLPWQYYCQEAFAAAAAAFHLSFEGRYGYDVRRRLAVRTRSIQRYRMQARLH